MYNGEEVRRVVVETIMMDQEMVETRGLAEVAEAGGVWAGLW